MKLIIKETDSILQLGESDHCFMCPESVTGKSFSRLYFQPNDESQIVDFGIVCESCSYLEPGIARIRLTEKFNQRVRDDNETERELEAIIYQSINVERLLEYLRSRIDILKDQVQSQREMEDRIRSMIETAEICTLISDDASNQFAIGGEDVLRRDIKNRPGYVYLLSSPDGHYKIGRAKDIPNRVNTLRIQLPFPIEIIHYFYSKDYCASEQIIHSYLSEYRLNGEWFRLDAEKVAWFKSLQDEV